MNLRLALPAAALVVAAAISAQAAVVLRASVEEMTDACHRCALGVAGPPSVALDSGVITTTWKVRVDETWIGDATGEVLVSVPGGTVGRITQEFPGGARLEEGRRVVVFLWKDAGGRMQVLGEAQGCFRVVRDEKTGEDVCENSLAGLSLVDRSGKPADAAPERFTLAVMRRRVADARTAREARERKAREAIETQLAVMRKQAQDLAERARGRPGAPPE